MKSLSFNRSKRNHKQFRLLLNIFVIMLVLVGDSLPTLSLAQTLPTANVTLSAPNSPTDPASSSAQTSVLKTVLPDAPANLKVAPVADKHLPSLALQIEVSPQIVTVGDTVTVKVTITNGAPDLADNLQVNLPLPAGVVALSDTGSSNSSSNTLTNLMGNTSTTTSSTFTTKGWQWSQLQLAANSVTSFSVQMQVVTIPSGQALLLHPSATANGLDLPVTRSGGAIVEPPSLITTSTSYVPGSPTSLKSADNRLDVSFPANGFGSGLTLQTVPAAQKIAALKAQPGAIVPPQEVGFHQGFGTFFLEATDGQNNVVHKFAQPLTLTAHYTPEQLTALQTSEDNLTLFYFDESKNITGADGSQVQGEWVPIESQINKANHTVSAQVDHFSAYSYGDGSSPSSSYIPSLQGFQSLTYTGAATFNFPIEVPAGPGGSGPTLSLGYDSDATDGGVGTRPLKQAGWVGKGWNLDPGTITMANQGDNGSGIQSFAMELNNQGFDLYRAGALPGTGVSGTPTAAQQTDLSLWDWHTSNENFSKIRAVHNGLHDGRDNRYKWQVWTRDGTMFEFAEDAWWGFCVNGMQTYKWQLSSIVDTHQNKVVYAYNRQTQTINGSCSDSLTRTVDNDIWPTLISWGNNTANTSHDFWRVNFVSSARTNDTSYEIITNQIGFLQQTRKLDAIQVQVNTSNYDPNQWQLLRQYNLGYDYSTTSDDQSNTTHQARLTLKSFQQIGNDGTSALPAKTFTYGGYSQTNPNPYPIGGWNRITGFNNGQGGTLSLTYENIAYALYSQGKCGGSANCTYFQNAYRLTQRTENGGMSEPNATWTYTYGTPSYNNLGTTVDQNTSPNSAVLYFNKHSTAAGTDYSLLLIHRAYGEFRGHNYVKVVEPDGTQVEHWYYQGGLDVQAVPGSMTADPACPINSSLYGSALYADSCFSRLRDREFLKGREYLTRVSGPASAGSPLLRETKHNLSLNSSTYKADYTDTNDLGAMWGGFVNETGTVSSNWESATPGIQASTPLTQAMGFTYSPAAQYQSNGGSSQFYGNVSQIDEFDQSGGTYRSIKNLYNSKDTEAYSATTNPRDTLSANYLVNRGYSTALYDGAGNSLGITNSFFDGNDTTAPSAPSIGTTGNSTLTRSYYDVPPTNAGTTTLNGTDQSTAYDSFGNVTKTSTFTQGGTALGSTYSISGNSSAARPSIVTYDSQFHVYPVKIESPTVNGNVLTYDYTWDYRMGTIINIANPNHDNTGASYDVYGRMTKMWKPGDSGSVPTIGYYYYDTEIPYRQLQVRNDTNGGRPTQTFYDGLGRVRQTKAQSVAGYQNIVTDNVYDGLGQLTKFSLPRYISETIQAGQPGSGFYTYATPSSDPNVMRWTQTSYDSLGRTLTITAPDSTKTEARYGTELDSGTGKTYQWTDNIDANRHRVRSYYDEFNRKVKVVEYSGNCGALGFTCTTPYTTNWVVYSTTKYAYDARHLLASITDNVGNVTTFQYDSQGRQTKLIDPDLGTATFTYDANGNLKTRVDAKNQTITYAYDVLNRLTTKTYPDSSTTTFGYDTGTTSGMGRRTSMTNAAGTVKFYYNTWGDTTINEYNLTNGGLKVFEWSYDAAHRVSTLKNPGGEVLTYTYDAAWRPIKANGFEVYVNNATYNALNQPLSWNLGNGLVQSYSYTTALSRLDTIKVGTSSNPGSLYNRSYTYDNVGNILTEADNIAGQTQNFQYDQLNHLTRGYTTGATGGAYDQSVTYDTIGNILTKGSTTYTYPAAGQPRPHAPTTVNGQTYTYDANGNLTSGGGRTYTWNYGNLTSGGGRTYTWNYDNLPASITDSSSVVETYTYDANLNRVSKTRGGTTTLDLLNNLWEETLGSGSQPNDIIMFDGKSVVQHNTSTNARLYLHGNQQGSINLLTTSSGTVSSQREYDAWGKLRSGTTSGTTLNFTGQKLDATGLLHLGARYYDPDLGKFVSPDPIVPNTFNPQSLNRYSYVLNNPVNLTDSSGHKAADKCFQFDFGGCWNDVSSFTQKTWEAQKDDLQTGLDVCGFAPVIGSVCSGANAVIDASEGDYTDAAIDAVGAIPGGKVAEVGKLAKAGKDVDKAVNVADDVTSDGTKLYRTMRLDPSDGKPMVADSARTLGVRPGPGPNTDIPINADGMVAPDTGGMSVNTDPSDIPSHRRKDPLWSINSNDLGDCLCFRPDEPPNFLNPSHGGIEPTEDMPYSDYTNALGETRDYWKPENYEW